MNMLRTIGAGARHAAQNARTRDRDSDSDSDNDTNAAHDEVQALQDDAGLFSLTPAESQRHLMNERLERMFVDFGKQLHVAARPGEVGKLKKVLTQCIDIGSSVRHTQAYRAREQAGPVTESQSDIVGAVRQLISEYNDALSPGATVDDERITDLNLRAEKLYVLTECIEDREHVIDFARHATSTFIGPEINMFLSGLIEAFVANNTQPGTYVVFSCGTVVAVRDAADTSAASAADTPATPVTPATPATPATSMSAASTSAMSMPSTTDATVNAMSPGMRLLRSRIARRSKVPVPVNALDICNAIVETSVSAALARITHSAIAGDVVHARTICRQFVPNTFVLKESWRAGCVIAYDAFTGSPPVRTPFQVLEWSDEVASSELGNLPSTDLLFAHDLCFAVPVAVITTGTERIEWLPLKDTVCYACKSRACLLGNGDIHTSYKRCRTAHCWACGHRDCPKGNVLHYAAWESEKTCSGCGLAPPGQRTAPARAAGDTPAGASGDSPDE